jgi:hypothetical protein
MKSGAVVLFGGTGIFGRLIGEMLGGARVACRRPPPGGVVADWRDPASVRRAIGGAEAVVAACGPFQGAPLAIVEEAERAGVPYVDIADARDYVARVRARTWSIPVFTGMSTIPGMTGFLVAHSGVGRVRAIRSMLSPAGRGGRGTAAVRSFLSSVGRPFRAAGRTVWGWTEPERLSGRTCFWVDVPDYDLFPERFGAREVVFKVGMDAAPANVAMRALAFARRVWGLDLERPAVVSAMLLLARVGRALGTDSSIVRVEVEGDRGRVVHEIATDEPGQRLAALPAVLAARAILAGRAAPGLRSLEDIVGFDEFLAKVAGLGARYLRVV